VTRAIADYHALIGSEKASAQAIAARLDHVVSYIATLPSAAVACEDVGEAWIARFRTWAAKQPIVSPTGKTRERSLGTIENSVLQLAAAITAAHKRGDTTRPAQFRAIPVKTLANTPRRRLSLDELADAFRFATDRRFPVKRLGLLRFLQISVGTAARPDAAHDVSTKPARGQWHSDKRVLSLNPKGRRQTKKYRATVVVPWQVAARLDEVDGLFVPAASVRSAFETMAESLGWPRDGENGLKLIRRSIAQLLRERGVPAEQIELQLGHRRIDSVTDLYAAFDPTYLREATAALEAIIDEIEARVPGAFHRNDTGKEPNIVPIVAAKKAR
jgi:integrase